MVLIVLVLRFDVQRFYNEAGRVLKPAGVLAVWSYGLPVIESPLRNIPYEALAAANSLLEQLYSVTLGQYWDERRALVESGYQVRSWPPKHRHDWWQEA